MLLLRDVKKSFAEPDGSPLPILDIEEFHVAPGEQMVLVGKSGCGKTTLLHVIAGITRPDCGKVRINDWDITLMPEAECDRFRAEHIGYVFQTFNLLRGFSALENVMLAMRFARLPSENAGPLAQLAAVLLDLGSGLPLVEKAGQLAELDFAAGGPQPGRAVAGACRPGTSHDAQAGTAFRGRAAARGRRPGPGQSPQAAAGRRADRQRRFGPSAADPRPLARNLPRGEGRRSCWSPTPRKWPSSSIVSND